MQHQSLNQQMLKIASSDDEQFRSVQPENGGQHSVAEAQKKESSKSNDKSSNAMQRVGRFNLKANTITEDEMVDAGEPGRTRGNHSKDAGVEVIQRTATEDEEEISIQEDPGNFTDASLRHRKLICNKPNDFTISPRFCPEKVSSKSFEIHNGYISSSLLEMCGFQTEQEQPTAQVQISVLGTNTGYRGGWQRQQRQGGQKADQATEPKEPGEQRASRRSNQPENHKEAPNDELHSDREAEASLEADSENTQGEGGKPRQFSQESASKRGPAPAEGEHFQLGVIKEKIAAQPQAEASAGYQLQTSKPGVVLPSAPTGSNPEGAEPDPRPASPHGYLEPAPQLPLGSGQKKNSVVTVLNQGGDDNGDEEAGSGEKYIFHDLKMEVRRSSVCMNQNEPEILYGGTDIINSSPNSQRNEPAEEAAKADAQKFLMVDAGENVAENVYQAQSQSLNTGGQLLKNEVVGGSEEQRKSKESRAGRKDVDSASQSLKQKDAYQKNLASQMSAQSQQQKLPSQQIENQF